MPKSCMSSGKKGQAIKSMWDALSEILEDPESSIGKNLKRKALEALKKAKAAFPEES